jgi:hypothetical protein
LIFEFKGLKFRIYDPDSALKILDKNSLFPLKPPFCSFTVLSKTSKGLICAKENIEAKQIMKQI